MWFTNPIIEFINRILSIIETMLKIQNFKEKMIWKHTLK
jgi:hypothetical protein